MGAAADDLNVAKVKKDALRDQIAQFHERSSSVLYLSLQWKDLDEHYSALHESLERKAEGLRSREEALRELCCEVEAKQHEFRCLEELIEFRCKELDSQADDLGEKHRAAIEEKCGAIEREIARRLEEIEEKEKSFQSESVTVQRLIDERFREVDRKEKQLGRREKRFADKLWNFEAERVKLKDLLGEVQSREKQLEGRTREFELETLEFESERERLSQMLKELESKDQQAEHRLHDLELKNKELEERRKGLESHIERLDLDRRKFGEQVKAVELREKQVEDRAKVLDLKSENLERRLQEIESDRTIYFVERGIFDVKLRELESDKRKFESDRVKLDGLLREAELKDKQSKERAENLEVKFKQLDERLREHESNKRKLDSGMERLNEQRRELDSKDKQVEGKNKELETSRRGLEEQVELFKLTVRELDERSREVEQKSNQREEKLQGFQDLRLRGCLTVDGKNLQVLLNECRNDHKKVENEVNFLLRMSHDPAKVVLDAMQGFFPPHLKKGDVECKGSNVRASCIFLLEILLNISPDIKEDVKLEARKLSFDWMTKLRPDWEHASHILGFLLLVASYKLCSYFDDGELISYAKVIARWRQVPGLCRMLGFREKMQDFIQDLLKRKEHMAALRFASIFDLLSNFPPDPIIKEFMEISSGAFKAIFDNENSPAEAKTQAKHRRISDLKAAKWCIEEQKLKCGYCPESIKLEILSLEKQAIDQRKAAEEVGNEVKIHGSNNDNDKVCSPPRVPSPVPSSIPPSAGCVMSEKAAVVVAPDTPLQQQNMEHSQQKAVLSAPADSNKSFLSLAPKLEQPAAVPTVQDDHLPMEDVIEDVRSTSSRNGPTELQRCPVDVPGEGLRLLLRGDLEDKLVQRKVSSVLESSPDPADLVFDALKGPHSSISGKDGSSCELGIPVKQSILLLKELNRVAYALNPNLKKKARIFAMRYISSLETTKNSPMGVIFLLQFCTVYKVWLTDVNEVISLLDPSIWCKVVPESCQLLGLNEDRCLDGFIKGLICKSKKFNALKSAEDMEKKSEEPRCGTKRKASECCHEERDTSQSASSVTASSSSKLKSQREWQNKRKTKFIDYSDPGINRPPHRKPYPRKPWFHKKMRGPFMDSDFSQRGRAQFLPQEEDDLYHPYFTDIHHQGR